LHTGGSPKERIGGSQGAEKAIPSTLTPPNNREDIFKQAEEEETEGRREPGQ